MRYQGQSSSTVKNGAAEQLEYESAQLERLKNLLFAPPNRAVSFGFASLIALFLSYFLWSENLQAKFGFLDDHQVAAWLGPGRTLTYFQAKQIFRSSEAMQPGEQQRFRPVYYLIRVGEAYLWSDNARLWYSARMVMFSVTVLLTGILAFRFFGLLVGGLLTLLIWTATYWGQIWSLLGPAETYACLAVAVYLWGIVSLFTPGSTSVQQTMAIAAIGLGSVVASGSKENFAALALPTAICTAIVAKKGGALVGRLAVLVGSIGFNLFVLDAVAKGTASGGGKDIYEQSVGASRLSKVWSIFAWQDSFVPILCVLAAVVMFAAMSAKRENEIEWRQAAWQRMRAPVVTVLTLFLLYGSQIAFYNGAWAPASRYAFPGSLLYWGAWLVLFLAADSELRRISPVNAQSLKVTVAVVLAGSIFWYGFETNRAFAAENKIRTQKIQSAVDRAAQVLQANAKGYLILYTATLNDYESVFAFKTYLDNRGLKGRVMLQLATPYDYQSWPPDLAKTLLPQMTQASNGQLGGFIPLKQEAGAGNCYRLMMSGNAPNDGCNPLGFVLD